jgi:hypothetical protein
MGDIADLMLNGEMCQGCGDAISNEGFPGFCYDCSKSPVDENGNDIVPDFEESK